MSATTTYAIVLREASRPNAEPIRRAFSNFHHLTEADAIRLAANAQGILMRQLPVDEAKALQSALVTEGVNAALVKDADLRFLPASEKLHRIELTHDALVIYDFQERTKAVAWADISLVAAAAVPHVEISSVQTQSSGLSLQALFGLGSPRRIETRQRLETERHFVLELIVGHGVARYEILAHQFPFKYVVDRPAAALTEKFVWLVRELTRRAPQALLNRAALDVRDGVTLLRSYPSRQVFQDEIVWLLWSRAHGHGER